MMRYLSACPVCNSTNLSQFLSCIDHTVSKERFSLEKCEHCGLVLTNPAPEEKELTRYYQSQDYISHSNKTSSPADLAYKLVRIFTLRWKYRLVHKYSTTKPNSILDFGCGTGDFLKECGKKGMSITGVEPSSLARQQAVTNTNTTIHDTLDRVTTVADTITLWHVLEHVSALNETIDSLKHLLAENGTMFIAVPNLQSPDARKYGAFWAAYDVPRHLWHFSRNTMQKLLARHQLKTTGIIPMKLDSYYVSMLSEKYQSGKLTLPQTSRALVSGLKSNLQARNTKEYSSLIYIARK